MAFISIADADKIFQKLEKGFIHSSSMDKYGDYTEWYFDKPTQQIVWIVKSVENISYVSLPIYKTKTEFIKFLTEIDYDSYDYSYYHIKNLV